MSIEFEIIEETDIMYSRQPKEKKAQTFYPYGSYSTERTYRDYWSDEDQALLQSLVRIRVIRDNAKGKVTVLDNLTQFRLLKEVFANELCDWLFNNEYKFVVYND
jgi:hypothetical protein